MTLPVQVVRYVYTGPYSVGATVPIPFTYMETDHVDAYKNQEQLTFNVDYSVTGQNVTLKTAIGASDKLVIVRQTPLNNDAEFPQEAEFDSAKINDAIDKLTMQNQEQQEQIDRALKVPIDSTTGYIVGLPSPDPMKCLKWNSAGSSLINSTYDPDSQVANAAYWAGQAQNYAEQCAAYLAQIQSMVDDLHNDLYDELYEALKNYIDERINTSFNGVKLKPITTAEYKALVEASTTDANTLYIITDA